MPIHYIKWVLIVFLTCLFGALLYAQENESIGKIESAWTEIGPNGDVFVRAILSEAKECPTLKVELQNNEKKELSLEKRPNYNADIFPVLVCQISIPHEVKSVQLGGRILPVLKKDIRRILLLGDSGCRLKKKMIQNCNDPNKWPLQKIAALIQEKKPDVIIHVGDYHYRETPCPEGKTKCQGVVSGDNWQSWNQDFFTPAQSMFSSAPILFLRGDHEACGRGGLGWFYLLEPGANEKVCQKFTEPYKVTLGSKTLLVFDTSEINDDKVRQKDLVVYEKQLAQLNKLKSNSENWFLTHKPVWGIGLPRKKELSVYENDFKTKELQALFAKHPFDSSFDLLVAGHIHMLQLLSLGKDYPPQLVTGNGGTLIEYYPPKYNSSLQIDGKKIEFFKDMEKFGVTILNIEDKNKVTAEIYNKTGHKQDVCVIEKREIRCGK